MMNIFNSTGDAATTMCGLLAVSSNIFWRGGDMNSKKASEEKHQRFFKSSGDIVTLYHVFTEWMQVLHSKEVIAEKPLQDQLEVLDEVAAKLAQSLQESLRTEAKEEEVEEDLELETNETTPSETPEESNSNDTEMEDESSGNSSSSTSEPMTPLNKELEETKVSKSVNGRTWCKENSINNKSLGIALATKKEIQRTLKKSPLWTGRPQTTVPSEQDIQRLLFKGFFLNLAYRVKKGTYRTVLSDTIGVMHPGCALKHQNIEPDWVVYQTILKTHKTMLIHVNPCSDQWTQEESPQFQKILDQNKAEACVECRFPQVGKAVTKLILGKFNSNVPALEKELQCTLEVDYETDGISAWCKLSVKNQCEENLKKRIEEAKEMLKKEVVEEVVIGNTRAVYGIGGVLTDFLFEGEYISINLRNLPNDWTQERIMKIASQYGNIRDCTLVSQGAENTKWSKVTFMKKSEAKAAFSALTGEVLGSKTIKVSPSTINAPSMLHEISGYITISWANGLSTGKADLEFLTAKSANEVITRNPFQCKVRAYGQMPGKAVNGRPKPPLTREGLFVEGGSSSSYSISLQGLHESTDEWDIETKLRGSNLPQPRKILLKRNPTSSNESVLEELSDLKLPFSTALSSRTSFFDEKKCRAGFRFFYRTTEDLLREVKEALSANLGLRLNQPIRAEVKYVCSVAIHKALWKKCKDKIEAAKENAMRNNVNIKEDLQSPARVILQLSSAKYESIINTRRRLHEALECTTFQSPDKHLLLTSFGRRRLQQFSDSMAYLHWDNANGIIRIYGNEDEQKKTYFELQKLVDELKNLEIDHSIFLQRGYRPPPNELASLKKKHELQDIQLVRGRLLVTGSKEAVAKLRVTLNSKIMEKKAVLSGADCLICCDQLDNPFSLQGCGHKFCTDCLAPFFAMSPIPLPLKCPQCNIEMIVRDIVKGASEASWNSIKQQATTKYVRDNAAYITPCFKRGCPQYLLIPNEKLSDGQEAEKGGHLSSCDQCKQTYCADCSIKRKEPILAHPMMTCTVRSVGTQSVEKIAKHIWDELCNTRCPRCKTVIYWI